MAAPCINISESCSSTLIVSTSVLFVSHEISRTHSIVQLLSVDMLLQFVCAKYSVIYWYQLVLLTMARLAKTGIATFLVF